MVLPPLIQQRQHPFGFFVAQLTGFTGMGIQTGNAQMGCAREATTESLQHVQFVLHQVWAQRLRDLAEGHVRSGQQGVQAPAAGGRDGGEQH